MILPQLTKEQQAKEERKRIVELLLKMEFECKCCGIALDPTGVCHGCKLQALVDEVTILRNKLSESLQKLSEIPLIIEQDKNNIGEWGSLPQEPCRFCRKPGGVIFQVNEGQKNLCDPQVVMCRLCKKDWIADSPLA